MKVLVACEESGKVREAFRAKGHDAISCDILPSRDSSPHHFQGDVMQILGEPWDMMIAFPPCTYLCNSGVRWLYEKPGRWSEMEKGAAFFKTLLDADIEKVCIENPVMHKYAKQIIGADYSQTIQPYEFGHMEVKRTCFWLRGLPELKPTSDLKAETMALPYAERARIHHAAPGPLRSRIRSETYQGIADAMAEQWG